MQLMQRLGNSMDDAYVDELLCAIMDHPGSCDAVWFATPRGFPTIQTHKEIARDYARYAEKFRAHGISVSLQLTNTLGHGEEKAIFDCTGLVYEGSPVEKIVGHNGSVADYCFCWRGSHIREYLQQQLACYVEALSPEYVWVDDDFRAIWHSPVDYGCFCDSCIGEFNRQHKYSFSRETLVEAFLHGDPEVRKQYIAFQQQGLADLMEAMGETIHAISPETALAFQHASIGSFTGYGLTYIFDAMKRSTGKIPAVRPGGGTYDDHEPNEILKKGVLINWQNAMLPDYVTRKCPEIENTPDVVFGKSPAGTTFETTYYLANGNTDMTYAMLVLRLESLDWHRKEFKLFSEHRSYWEKLSEYSKVSSQAGIQRFMSPHAAEKQIGPEDGMEVMDEDPIMDLWRLIRNAIPISYDRQESTAWFLDPATAAYISEDEVEFLLGKPVITCGETIAILAKRGYDMGIHTEPVNRYNSIRIHERFTDHPVNPKGFDEFRACDYVSLRKPMHTIACGETTADSCLRADSMEILGVYDTNVALAPFSNDPAVPYGIAEAIFTTKLGAKWAVLGNNPWVCIVPTYRRDHILDIAEYISGKSLNARVLSPIQAVLLPRMNKDGQTVSVSITNCTIGDSDEITLLIRNPAGEHFVFMSQYDGTKELSFRKDGNDFLLTLPSLHPWSVGTVFID